MLPKTFLDLQLLINVIISLIRDPSWQFWGFIVAIAAFLITLWSILRANRRKQITYEVLSDNPIANISHHVQGNVEVYLNGRPARGIAVLNMKVWNSGKTAVTANDYTLPIEFGFGGRNLVSSDIYETEPPRLIDLINRKNPNTNMQDPDMEFSITPTPAVKLPKLPLNPMNSMSVRVFHTGPECEVTQINGELVNGEIKKHTPNSRRIINRRNTLIALGLLMIGVLVGILVVPPPPIIQCVSGSITINGSSALYSLVKPVAQNYQAQCTGATIIIGQSTSSSGLADVQAGNIQLGNSEISALPNYPDLVDHPIAVVIFAIIINKNIGVDNLTTLQLQSIYNGSIYNWKQVGGPDLPITVISRISTSGTRKTFEKYILGVPENLPMGPNHKEIDRSDEAGATVQNTNGAIGYVDLATATHYSEGVKIVSIDNNEPQAGLVVKNTYKFWSIEHMYTKGLPPPESLTNIFLTYMTGNYAKVIASSLQYVNITNMSQDALNSHQFV